ncbi:MAG: GWxTD domain-containing protein [Candidatus Eisenbacteria bacterium]|nr:GWxTD domain-containing protein [Candidatus Eisenbacteria bacterium]
MPRGRARALTAFLVPLLAAAALRPPWAHADAASDAAALYTRGLAYDARGSIEARRMAMQCLERATLLQPDQAEYQLALGRVYYRMGFLRQARGRFQRVERLDPQSTEARMGLGAVWRRDYMKYIDRTSLARAVDDYSAAARLDPGRVDAWLALVPLLVEQKDLRAASAAAARGLEADAARPEAMLAVAYTSFRLGAVARAESCFRSAIPRLPQLARERFDDIAPVASEADTAALRRLPPAARPEFIRRFWREHDPDLASPENEAQLEYWARVAQAFFLFFDAKRREWDERGEVYVRYGPPEAVDYNPVGVPGEMTFGTGSGYPLNTLVWSYPSLGMSVQLQDRLLSEYYLLPMSLERDMDPLPDPAAVAARGDLLAAPSGRAVFPMLPPGTRPLPVDGILARFGGERGPRLFGQVTASALPDDSLHVDWVVLDTTMSEVARAARAASVSACDPAAMRAADFAAELPPGRYIVGMTVRDGRGGRGVFRSTTRIAAAPAALSVSDPMVLCGRPEVTGSASASPAVRLEANPGAVITANEPLGVYFEMYGLAPDASGTARFEYQCTVASAEKDSRFWLQRLLDPRPRLPDISASRRDEQPGTLRRQFVSVPIGELKNGRYRLEIKVRDLNADTEAATSIEFVKHVAGS